MGDAERLAERRVKPDKLAISDGDWQRVIAYDELRTWVVDERRHARIVRIEVGDLTRWRVHYQACPFHLEVG